MRKLGWLILLVAAPCFGQTASQFLSGTTLPATCTYGDVYAITTTFNTYYCSATNTWVQFVPLSGATFTGPVNAPTLEGTLFADQWQSPAGTGNNGISRALTNAAGCPAHTYACAIVAPTQYAKTEAQPWGGAFSPFSYPTGGPTSSQSPYSLGDQRFGALQEFTYYGTNYYPRLMYGSAVASPNSLYYGFNQSLLLESQTLGGGREMYPPGGDKTTDGTLAANHWKYTQGQTYGFAQFINGFGNGDLVGHFMDTGSYGGPATESDEGNESMRFNAFEQGVVFGATLSSISAGSDGSETIATTSQANNGTQGEGRIVIDLTKKYNTGYISQIVETSGYNLVTCTGCTLTSINGSSTQTTLSTAITNGGSSNNFPQSSVTLSVASSTGFTVGHIACVFDYDYECEKITAVATGTITIATDRIPHPVGAWVTTGGLAGYAWEATADEVCATATGSCTGLNGIQQPIDSNLASVVRYAVPIMANNGNIITLANGYNQLPGNASGYNGRAYTTMGSGGTVSLTVSGGAVTSCTASGGSGYGGILSPPQVSIAGTWTTAPIVNAYGTGVLSSCKVVTAGAGITGTPVATVVPTNSYATYPAAKVYGVYDASAGAVNGTLYTEPVAGTFAVNDSIEEPHYYLQHTNGMANGVGQYIPAQGDEPHQAISYGMTGIWQDDDAAAVFANGTSPSVYWGNPSSAPWVVGQGQLIPPQGIELNGPFSTGIFMGTPPSSSGDYDYFGSAAVLVLCGAVPCSQWTQGYNYLYAWNALGSPGLDFLNYQPPTGIWSLTSGGPGGGNPVPCTYTFSPTGLSYTGTTCSNPFPLKGTTGSIGGSALTAGTCSSATVSVSGATTSMAVEATPSTYPGDAIYWKGYVSASGTVTVKVCAAVAATPTASTYNVRVIP